MPSMRSKNSSMPSWRNRPACFRACSAALCRWLSARPSSKPWIRPCRPARSRATRPSATAMSTRANWLSKCSTNKARCSCNRPAPRPTCCRNWSPSSPPRARAPPRASLAEQLSGYHRVAQNGHQWRLFILRDRQSKHLILAAEREDVRGELVQKIALRSLLPDLVGLPLLALLVWLAIGWGLRPLQRMAESIKARAPDNLAPLVFDPLPQELEPMGAAINRLLLQVNQLLDQEKRFIADAAHELRTPLAVLRIHAQNALEAPDPADRREALRQLGAGVDRATRVVAQLLTLARLDPNVVQLAMREVNLLDYLRNDLAELTPLALERHQELSLEADETADYHLLADGPSLGTLLQNLVGNALQYTPDGGRIQVQLEAQADAIVLRVQDSGPGVSEAQREKLFERFYRLGEGQGAGPGLSIVLRGGGLPPR